MLQITGKSLGTRSEWVDGPSGRFESIEIGIETGEGWDRQVQAVRPSRDFPAAEFPKEGETVTLNVIVSAFATRNGAGYRLVALSRARSGARVAPVANAG